LQQSKADVMEMTGAYQILAREAATPIGVLKRLYKHALQTGKQKRVMYIAATSCSQSGLLQTMTSVPRALAEVTPIGAESFTNTPANWQKEVMYIAATFQNKGCCGNDRGALRALAEEKPPRS
jgi:hypothetical protein